MWSGLRDQTSSARQKWRACSQASGAGGGGGRPGGGQDVVLSSGCEGGNGGRGGWVGRQEGSQPGRASQSQSVRTTPNQWTLHPPCATWPVNPAPYLRYPQPGNPAPYLVPLG